MSPGRKRRPRTGGPGHRYARLARVLAIAASAAGMTLAFAWPPAASAAQSPPAPNVQETEAIVQPSVVFIQTKWTGWLTNAKVGDTDLGEVLSGEAGMAPKFQVTTSCSGYIANPNGYVVTAGHCVDDQSVRYGGKGLIIDAAIAKLAGIGDLSASELSALRNYAYQNWTVEGTEKGSPPDRAVGVFPTVAASGTAVSTPYTANVISARPFDQGDVALLKISTQAPLPALDVAPGAGSTDGTPVVAAGYPGSVTQTVDPSTEPSVTDGRISGEHNVNGVPFTEITAATSAGMSGGPVADSQGRVVGTVSWSPGNETQAFNFITATSSIRDLLASNGVSSTLSQTDQAYRAGLADYFTGKYHAAVTQFDQVLAMEPSHAQAQQYKRLAIADYPKEQTGGSNTLLFVSIAAGALVVALAVTGVLIVRRRRHGGAVTGTGPVPGAPRAPAAQGPPPAGPPAEATAGPPAVVAQRLGGEETEPARHARFCPHCGEPHEADALFCAACGFHFPPMAHGQPRQPTSR